MVGKAPALQSAGAYFIGLLRRRVPPEYHWALSGAASLSASGSWLGEVWFS